MRRNKYFGILDASDLLQETMLSLYLKVPKHYDKTKGSLRNYCLAAAKNCIRRLANQQYRHQAEVSVDWHEICETSHGDATTDDTSANVYAQAVKKITVEPDAKSTLFKVRLAELAKHNKDFEIVQTVHKHDTDRKAACKELGISNASITKVFKRVRRHKSYFTLTDKPVKEYIETGVNVFTRPCIDKNMRVKLHNTVKV